MTRFRALAGGLLLLAAFLWLAGCSDSSTEPGGGGGTPDTTAPQVAGVDPTNGEAGVPVDESIDIVFSEAMDPASSTGNVTLSSGTITSMDWTDTRTLHIDHTNWTEGEQVTVTVGTGLADAAGNTLAAPYSFSFYVFTSAVTVLETTPAAGATDVNRSTSVQILFSTEMDLATISAFTTISSPDKANYEFTPSSEHSMVFLDITGDLPASTTITVAMTTGVTSTQGTPLDAPVSFSFTTGAEIDVTPPTVVAVSPANGSTIATDVGVLQVTFSEPMDPSSFEPTRWNAEFAFLMFQIDPSPTWSDNFTVVTVPLPSPLPAGLPIEVTFGNFTDANGVAQSTPWTWDVTVTGTAEYYPTAGGTEYVFGVFEEEGNLGNQTPTNAWDYVDYLRVDDQGGGVFHLAGYDQGFLNASGEYDKYRRTASAIQWLGFREVDEGGTPEPELLFDSPLDVLPVPLAVGTWSDNTTVTIPGEGTFAADLSGTVSGPLDRELADTGGELFFKDAYRVVRVLNVEVGGELVFVERDTVWYAATLGPVEESHYDEEYDVNRWFREMRLRLFDIIFN